MEHFQQRLEDLLTAAIQQSHEDIVEDHLCIGRTAAQPKDVIFAEGHLKLTVLFEHFYLLLN